MQTIPTSFTPNSADPAARSANNRLAPAPPMLVRSDPQRRQALIRAALVDEIATPLIACEVGLRIAYANRAGEAELAHGTLLARAGAQLRCHGGQEAALDGAVRQAIGRGRRQLLTLVRMDDHLTACVMPLQLPDTDAALAAVMLGRRAVCSALALQMLASTHGLTSAEQRVLAALVTRSTPNDIAARHGVAISTVRTQIGALRTKLGVHTIEELVIRAAQLPPLRVALHHQTEMALAA